MHDLLKSARDGNRTRTDITAHRILSPACLPIPPPGRPKKSKHGFDTVPGTMSERRDSNPRPQPWQGCALPAELLLHLIFGKEEASRKCCQNAPFGCPRPDLNRHGHCCPQDFKSCVSTNFTTRASFRLKIQTLWVWIFN